MSKHYKCDHCDREVHYSKKVSITGNDDSSFNVLKGNCSDGGSFIHRKNFYRMDFCDLNCMVKSFTNSKYKVVKVDKQA